jgi:hypothetical protein
MRPALIVLLLAFVVSGCATAAHVRLAPEDRARLAGGAALPKARLDEAADACADTLARGLTTAQPGLVPPR